MKKYKYINYYLLIFIVLVCTSLGYAILNKSLIIIGNTEVKKNVWDIRFDNVQIRNGSVYTDNAPSIDNSAFTVSFGVNLDLPGDFYEFSVDVKNAGTIDAMIDSVVKMPELTERQKKYINYMIEYQNGEEIMSKQIILKEDYVRIKVKIEYRDDLDEIDLPDVYQNLDLSFTLNLVQADNTGSVVKNHGIISVNGDINEVGSVVTIGTEKFYTMGIEDNNVKLLSMYNLYVGGDYDVLNDTWTEYGSEADGMQNENMLAKVTNSFLYKGTTPFSTTSNMGVVYNDYVGSLVEDYVINYKNNLEEKFDISINEARLVTMADITVDDSFACSSSSCKNSPYPFIYATSYWLGDPRSTRYVYYVDSDGKLYNSHHSTKNMLGVRSVIVISKNYF